MKIASIQNYNGYLNNNTNQTQPAFSAKMATAILPKTVAEKLEIPKGLSLRNYICSTTKGNKMPELAKDFDKTSGRLVRMTQYNNNKICAIYEYNPATEKMIREISFDEKGLKAHITDFDEMTGNIKQVTAFWADSEKIDSITEYNPKNGALLKVSRFQQDGTTLDVVGEYNPQNSELVKEIKYKKDGKRIYGIKNYDPENGKLIATKSFQKDGKTLKTLTEYDLESQPAQLKILRYTDYYPDGRIKSIDDPVENTIHIYEYKKDKTLDCVCNKPFDKKGFETRTRATEQGQITFAGPTLAADNKNFDPSKPRTVSSFKPTFVKDD